jgi:hypothetical protein
MKNSIPAEEVSDLYKQFVENIKSEDGEKIRQLYRKLLRSGQPVGEIVGVAMSSVCQSEHRHDRGNNSAANEASEARPNQADVARNASVTPSQHSNVPPDPDVGIDRAVFADAANGEVRRTEGDNQSRAASPELPQARTIPTQGTCEAETRSFAVMDTTADLVIRREPQDHGSDGRDDPLATSRAAGAQSDGSVPDRRSAAISLLAGPAARAALMVGLGVTAGVGFFGPYVLRALQPMGRPAVDSRTAAVPAPGASPAMLPMASVVSKLSTADVSSPSAIERAMLARRGTPTIAIHGVASAAETAAIAAAVATPSPVLATAMAASKLSAADASATYAIAPAEVASGRTPEVAIPGVARTTATAAIASKPAAGPAPAQVVPAVAAALSTPPAVAGTMLPDAAPANGANAIAATPGYEPRPIVRYPEKIQTVAHASPVQVAALLQRADGLLAAGDVASARLFYERAASAGDATAALRLGETYDVLFLSRTGLTGVSGDLAAAAHWYRRARELGATEAEILLKSVENR